MKGKVQRLRAEIRNDRDAFERRAAEVSSLSLLADCSDREKALAAVCLHHAYGAVESIMERLCRFFEGDLPSGPEWHQHLLTSMGLAIEDIRPAAFSPKTIEELQHLLGFRHFFRHSYAMSLEESQLASLRDHVGVLAGAIAKDLDRLDTLLGRLAKKTG